MARLPNISKYWVVCRSAASASLKVYSRLVPSMGTWGVPLTIFGSGRLTASSTVGATSMTCPNWLRMPPLLSASMPSGQCTTMPFRVPPKSLATCLVHLNGASKATAQPADMCGKVSGLPHLSISLIRSSTFSSTPLK